MIDLRWIEGPVQCTDLVDGSGRVHGYVGPTAKGTRGYVVQSGSEWPPRFLTMADHASDAAARVWVEAEVAARSIRPVRVVRQESGAA